MVNKLEQLVDKRKALFRRLEEVGDCRRGIISVNYRKCGKPNCVCTKEGHPGHGPQYLWNTTIKGKSYAKSLKIGAELSKYIEEIASYKKFLELYGELVAVNEQICNLRPVPEIKDEDELLELKKKLQRQFMKKYKKKVSRYLS